MTFTNKQIAAIFDEIADMLEIKGETIHRVLAYRNAAETIADHPYDITARASAGDLARSRMLVKSSPRSSPNC